MPSPIDVEGRPTIGKMARTLEEVVIQPNVKDPFSGLVFKIMTDPFVGILTFIRVYSGELKAGSYVYNVRTNTKERVSRLVRMHANKREEIDSIKAGDIGAVVGLKML